MENSKFIEFLQKTSESIKELGVKKGVLAVGLVGTVAAFVPYSATLAFGTIAYNIGPRNKKNFFKLMTNLGGISLASTAALAGAPLLGLAGGAVALGSAYSIYKSRKEEPAEVPYDQVVQEKIKSKFKKAFGR